MHRARDERVAEGPFVDEATQPLVCTPDRGGSIDPNPIVVNGQVFLLWQSFGVIPTEPTRLWSTPLTGDGLSVAGPSSELTVVKYNSQEWPNIEGPTMMPAPGGGFLLFYSAGEWWTTGYRTFVQYCTSPTGGCSRIYTTPVLATRDTMAGPGGPSVFQDPAGNWMMAFHAWTSPFIGYQYFADIRYAALAPPPADHVPQRWSQPEGGLTHPLPAGHHRWTLAPRTPNRGERKGTRCICSQGAGAWARRIRPARWLGPWA